MKRGNGVLGAKSQFSGGEGWETRAVYEALFADDLVFFSRSESEFHSMVGIFDELITQFGQLFSVKKT